MAHSNAIEYGDIMIHPKCSCLATTVALAMLACSGTSFAAEGFQIRYNLAGSLSGDMFAPPNQTGWAGAIATTYFDNRKVTGDDGLALTAKTPAGSLDIPGLPRAMFPAHDAGTVEIDGTGTFKLLSLAVGYITTDKYAAGRLVFVFSLPLGEKTQRLAAEGPTPTLVWNPAIPASVRTATAAAYDTQYQSGIAAMASAETGKVTGVGDAELQAGWLYVRDKIRVLAGASIVIPTGKYSSSPGPDIGPGNFYTFRPAVQAAYLITPAFALAGKVTLGLNTRNKDNDLRSGNWAGMELAAGYKTPVGVVGVQGIRVQQYQDDRNSPWGASRFRLTNGGMFFTTKLPVLDATMTAQYLKTISSRNAKHGAISQLRVVKLF